MQILVGCLTIDCGLVEAAEGAHYALLALAWWCVNPGSGEFLPSSCDLGLPFDWIH